MILLFQSFTFNFSVKTASCARCIMREHLKPHKKGILPVEAQQHVRVLAFDHFWQLSQPLYFAARRAPSLCLPDA